MATDLRQTLSSPLSCTVCTSIFHRPVSLPDCSHTFCGSCVFLWFRDHDNCPICRKVCRESAVTAHTIKAVVEAYLDAFKDERRSPRDVRRADSIWTTGEIKPRHGIAAAPFEEEEEEEEATISPPVPPRNENQPEAERQWWNSEAYAMGSGEDLTLFIENLAIQEGQRQAELLGQNLSMPNTPSRESADEPAHTPATTVSLNSSAAAPQSTLLWEPCISCYGPNRIKMPPNSYPPFEDFTCPHPITELEEFPSTRNFLWQDHGKCTTCRITFPIPPNRPVQDHTCFLCTSFWCGNILTSGCPANASTSLTALTDHSTWSFLTPSFFNLPAGEHHLLETYFATARSQPLPLEIINSLCNSSTQSITIINNNTTYTIRPTTAYACPPCARTVLQHLFPIWWRSKKLLLQRRGSVPPLASFQSGFAERWASPTAQWASPTAQRASWEGWNREERERAVFFAGCTSGPSSPAVASGAGVNRTSTGGIQNPSTPRRIGRSATTLVGNGGRSGAVARNGLEGRRENTFAFIDPMTVAERIINTAEQQRRERELGQCGSREKGKSPANNAGGGVNM